MNINIRLTINAPAGWKRRLLLYVAVPLAVLAGAAGVAYANLTTFNEGDTLSAKVMNDNFTSLQQQIDKTNALPRRGIWKANGAPTTGKINSGAHQGLQGAKDLCVTAVGSASAHMCDSSEMVQSGQLGINLLGGASDVWISTGIFISQYPQPTYVSDCQLFTTDTDTVVYGMAWEGTQAAQVGCDTSHPIACCD